MSNMKRIMPTDRPIQTFTLRAVTQRGKVSNALLLAIVTFLGILVLAMSFPKYSAPSSQISSCDCSTSAATNSDVGATEPPRANGDIAILGRVAFSFVLATLVFLAIGFPVKQLNAQTVSIFSNGISRNDIYWEWSVLTTVLISIDQTTTRIALFANEHLAIEVIQETSPLQELVKLIVKQTKVHWLPRWVEDFHAGKTVTFGNLQISSTSIRHNDKIVLLDDISSFTIADDIVIINKKDGQPALVVFLSLLPNTHLLPDFLSAVFPQQARTS